MFCLLIFQHPNISEDQIEEIIIILAENRKLFPYTFVTGIEALEVGSVQDLLASRYQELSNEIERIRKYRNKLLHGQITGQGIRSPQLNAT